MIVNQESIDLMRAGPRGSITDPVGNVTSPAVVIGGDILDALLDIAEGKKALGDEFPGYGRTVGGRGKP